MKTTEKNKLIAEFMGLKFNKGTFYNMGYDVFSNGNLYGKHELKYHKYWDWLMPVVQKIKDTPTYGSTDGVDFVLTCDLTKENLYESVVEFIKYYNEEKN